MKNALNIIFELKETGAKTESQVQIPIKLGKNLYFGTHFCL